MVSRWAGAPRFRTRNALIELKEGYDKSSLHKKYVLPYVVIAQLANINMRHQTLIQLVACRRSQHANINLKTQTLLRYFHHTEPLRMLLA